jgi:hypothetical protein
MRDVTERERGSHVLRISARGEAGTRSECGRYSEKALTLREPSSFLDRDEIEATLAAPPTDGVNLCSCESEPIQTAGDEFGYCLLRFFLYERLAKAVEEIAHYRSSISIERV